MRLHYVTRDNKRKVHWTALLAFVLLAYAGVIGAAELFWRLLTGGFSPLVGGFALVAATLFAVRTVGACLFAPEPFATTRVDTP